MHSHSPTKSTWLAAFLLGALLGLLFLMPARAAQPFRLDRIAIVRFTSLDDGRLRRHTGTLSLEGKIEWRTHFDIARPANTPAWALDHNLITPAMWQSYRLLGSQALENFELSDGGAHFALGEETFHFVYPREDAYFAAGTLVNLSTRARLIGAGHVITAGFVVHDRPRAVLVRAVGPTLARHGVTNAAPNPRLSIRRQDQTLYTNDNWNDQPDATFIRKVASRVGATPLDEGGRDAARIVLLDPGIYTVNVESAGSSAGGEVVVEIYDVPADLILEGEFGA